MPQTAVLFLIGSVAIVGLPPLNGFVSEWLIFLGLLASGLGGGDLRPASTAAAGLALTGALALACFAKVFSVTFLGESRGAATETGPLEARGMVLPQWFLAACCAAIGVAPMFAISAIRRITDPLLGAGAIAANASLTGEDALSLSVVSASVLALGGLIWATRRGMRARRPAASAPTWSCGFAGASSRTQYTGSSFAAPLISVFGPLSGSRRVRDPVRVHTEPLDPVLDRLGRPGWKWMRGAASDLRRLQSGGIRWYLLYTILCLLGLLVYLRFVAPR
jgi:NADH:ubiquinone oxidoreductase subunit 5 (subunit L)/multisubunit Na+/H+ antiporter MnhA subunit